jgi:HEAT repeat protein
MKDHRQLGLDLLLTKLDDLDPNVRRDAAIALGDFCPKDHPAVNVLIKRLRSPQQKLPDRGYAAWALGRIGAKAFIVTPLLLAVIEETKDQTDADELRLGATRTSLGRRAPI